MTPDIHRLRIKGLEQGLSLIEGLIAASLVALAFIAISNLFPTGYSNITFGGNQTLAESYAQQKIEQLKNLPFNSIDANCSSAACENLGDIYIFCRKCFLTAGVGVFGNSLVNDLKKVRVEVTWSGGVRTGSLSVDTLFTR